MLVWTLRNWQGLVVGLALAIGPSYFKGRLDGAASERSAAITAAAVATAKRISEMGKNDAELRTMPKTDLCRELLATSGLRDTTACDFTGDRIPDGPVNVPGNR